MFIFLSAYSLSLIYSSSPSSANFPGRALALEVTHQWRTRYGTPLSYVAGSRWLGGNVAFYSSDHPAVFMEWDKRRAFWINIEKMKKQGAVFIYDLSEEKTLPATVKEQFPALTSPIILQFDWHRNVNHLSPIKIGVAFLPPNS